jgi:outer membrane protein assembly factor BamB
MSATPDDVIVGPSASRGLRRADVIFTTIVLVVIGGGLSAAWLAPIEKVPYDYKNFFSFVSVLVGVLLIGGWFWFRSAVVMHWKLIVPVVVIGLALMLVKITNATGDFRLEFGCRLMKDPDELLPLPQVRNDPPVVDLTQTTPHDYPRFLGADGQATVTGIRLATDWETNPPREVWRHEIGAGWSAFSIVGDYAVTQEQRGEYEYVVCYALRTGETLWAYRDEGRHSNALGGVGPSATPTIDEGRVYTQGAFGILNCLDGATGEVIWSTNILEEHNADYISWGRSGSPLIVDDKVIVSAGGPNGRSLVAYNKLTGKVIWSAGDDRASYASPVYAVLGGVPQIVTVNEGWVRGHRASDGKPLWKYEWESNSDETAATSNPVPIDDSRVFLSKGYTHGCALIAVENQGDGKSDVRPLQRSTRNMQTKMTNVVVHEGYVYGLSGGILECLRLDDFKRMWKGGHYGHGQVMRIGDVLLVVTETGELVLVELTPDKHRKLTSIQALEDKTWNNPALSGRHLLVRNHREAVCYELPVVEEQSGAPGP